jgi:hypothetical protein
MMTKKEDVGALKEKAKRKEETNHEWNKNPLRTKKEKYKCHGSNLD